MKIIINASSLLFLLGSAVAANEVQVGAVMQMGADDYDGQQLRGTTDFPPHERELWWSKPKCRGHSQSCGPFAWCCDGYTCNTGIGADYKCYHSPRQEGEPCGPINWCRHDLFCGRNFRCQGLENIFESGTRGTCSGLSVPGQVKIMSYNLFLITCFLDLVACEAEPDRGRRVQKLTDYFRNRDEDVVMFQEVFSHWDDVRDAMTNAGYCHYITTQKGQEGSGMAIYSKFPMDNFDFIDWFDAFGEARGGTSAEIDNFEAFADKGVMYARVRKDGTYFHVTNTHTQSDSRGDEFDVRRWQYDLIREVVDRQNIPSSQMVLMGGDYNEDRACSQGLGPGCTRGPSASSCQVDGNGEGTYYKALKQATRADIPPISGIAAGVGPYTHDTSENPFLASRWEGETCNSWDLLLDYVFYSTAHKQPAPGSSCEIVAATDANDGSDLSDHFPISCTYVGL